MSTARRERVAPPGTGAHPHGMSAEHHDDGMDGLDDLVWRYRPPALQPEAGRLTLALLEDLSRLLIVHGLADSNVSPENTKTACRDLLAAKIPFDLVTFDDEGHGIYKAGNREKLMLRIERFFSKAFA